MNWLSALFGFFKVSCPKKFLSPDQIITEMVAEITRDAEARWSWLLMEEENLISGHHLKGRGIRNRYRFWDPENPHTSCADPHSPRHPDNLSQRIIEKVWKQLQNLAEINNWPRPSPEEIAANRKIF